VKSVLLTMCYILVVYTSTLYKEKFEILQSIEIMIISGKPVSQYASYLLIFNPLHSIINGEQHEKYFFSQFSHYGKYGMFDC